MSANPIVQEAMHIADRFAAEAVWSGNRCTWIQRIMQEPNDPLGRGPRAESLSGDIYSGTAGIAWFLAKTYAVSKKDSHKVAALGAIRHALQAARRAEKPAEGPWNGLASPSFYSGAFGIGWLAFRIGQTLQDGGVVNEAKGVLAEYLNKQPLPVQTDVLGGDAGTILALADLHALGETRALTYATKLGDRLLSLAIRQDGWTAWPWVSGGKTGRPLTGYSHGAAGYAHALLVLAKLTNEAKYEEAAQGALAYERLHFQAGINNWPDFRDLDGRAKDTTQFMLAWCHGAPGIGASRTAMPIDPEAVKAEVAAALESTMGYVREKSRIPDWNYTCCHGMAGNIACADLMARHLGDEGTRQELIEYVGTRVRMFGMASRQVEHAGILDWPTGRPGYVERSLLKGLAGTGFVLLSLGTNEEIPSFLIPGRFEKPDRHGLPGAQASASGMAKEVAA